MPKVTIDGQELEVAPGTTILQACQQAGIEIPHFCYHERLNIAGNCRMCLVEVKPGPPKPQASCALPAAENMEIFTDTPMLPRPRAIQRKSRVLAGRAPTAHRFPQAFPQTMWKTVHRLGQAGG